MLIIACRTRITTKTTKISPSDTASAKLQDEVETPEVEERELKNCAQNVVDRGDDGDQAEQVEPAGEPGPARAAELVGPPVGPAGRRIGGGQLRHEKATVRMSAQMIGQPHEMAIGPPLFHAWR